MIHHEMEAKHQNDKQSLRHAGISVYCQAFLCHHFNVHSSKIFITYTSASLRYAKDAEILLLYLCTSWCCSVSIFTQSSPPCSHCLQLRVPQSFSTNTTLSLSAITFLHVSGPLKKLCTVTVLLKAVILVILIGMVALLNTEAVFFMHPPVYYLAENRYFRFCSLSPCTREDTSRVFLLWCIWLRIVCTTNLC